MNPTTELGFLMNPSLYKKYIKKEQPMSKEEVKFYRRRILQLSRNMFKDNKYPQSLRDAFEDYIKIAIEYFKTDDIKDIIQEEYDHLEIKDDPDFKSMDNSLEEATRKIFNVPPKTIKDFVNIIRTTKTSVLPEKKTIELSDPKLKMKGVKKKIK